MHYLLVYEFVPDFLDRRGPYRAAHLGMVRDAHARGEVVMAGALADPPAGGLLVFRGDSAAAAEAFAAADPYVTNGLVASWRVRPWSTVVGDGAVMPPF